MIGILSFIILTHVIDLPPYEFRKLNKPVYKLENLTKPKSYSSLQPSKNLNSLTFTP